MAEESQDAFVRARQPRWAELDRALDGTLLHRRDGPTIGRIASLYRMVGGDLMRARASGYTPDLVAYLDRLVSRGHNAIYTTRANRVPTFLRDIFFGFPQTLRRRWAFFALSTALFSVPLVVGVVGAYASPDFATDVIPAGQLQQMVENYSTGFDEGRATGTDTSMAGFYIRNNIGIAFRCFATGILFCLGSVFFLVYNGLMIGTVTGFVGASGYAENILTFMCGHAPFELTAILISGGAGLQMGWSLVATDGLTRIGSLRRAAPDLARLIIGAAFMLLIAAFIEGFWSPSSVPAPVKWAVSAVLSAGVAAYLLFAGRGRAKGSGAPSDDADEVRA
ncbi:MAG: stage II sporulation protein M [Myxococcota bacterium]